MPLPLTGQGYVRLWQIGTATHGWAVPAQAWHGLIHWAMKQVRDSRVTVVMANCKFDMHAMAKEGWPLPHWEHVEDVIVLSRLVQPEERQHGLKPSAVRNLGRWAGAGQSNLREDMAKHGWTWETIPVDTPSYWGYGVVDVLITVQLWNHLSQGGVPPWYEVEQEYQRITWGMERRGLRLDPEAVQYADDLWYTQEQEIGARLAEHGITNPNSPRQLDPALRALGFEPEVFSDKTGDPTMDRAVLKSLEMRGGTLGEVARLVIQYRTVSKWRANYGTSLLGYSHSDDTVHPSILTMQARTGRSSITSPALQTIPKSEITRNMFRARRGCEMWAIDYSSQEVRLHASLAEDEAMVSFFSSGDGDYHTYVAELAGIPRQVAKTVNYARAYGATPLKMAETAGVSEVEMTGYLAEIDRRFTRAMKWKDEVTALAEARTQRDGYPWLELPYGRKVALDAGREYTQAANTMIQGTGADVLKLAACRLAAAGYEEWLLLPVHDELLFEVPEGTGADEMKRVAEIMEDHSFLVPLTTDITGPLTRWGEAYKESN